MKPLIARGRRVLFGVIHLRPLPGAPRWDGSMESVIKAAVDDACAYIEGGADSLLIENFGDVPFRKTAVPAETIAAMAVAAAAVRAATDLPLGFNVLRNDAHGALALCAACNGAFIRVNILSGAMVTDQGLIEGDAFGVTRLRRSLAPEAQILADVHVKHAAPLGERSIEDAARDTSARSLADALIVSGTATGAETSLDSARRVRSACPDTPLLIGSGVTAGNAASYLDLADGFIVGTSVKRNGEIAQPVEAARVRALRQAIG